MVVAAVIVASAVPTVAFAASAPAGPQTIVNDTFARSVAAGWGSTPQHQKYVSSRSSSAHLSVKTGTGDVDLGAGQGAQLTVDNTQADDTRVEASAQLTRLGGPAYYAFTLRSQANGQAYRVRLYFNAAGIPFLGVNRVSRGGETTLDAVRLGGTPVTLGQPYRLAVTVTGHSPVRIAASFVPGAVASSTPQMVYTDSSSQRIGVAGGIGFWAYASTATRGMTGLKLSRLLVQNRATPLGAHTSTNRSQADVATSTPASAVPAAVTPASPARPVPAPAAPAPAPAAPAPAPTPQVGSAPVGTTAYPVPSGALFVSASAQPGGNGSAAHPFASVQAAVNTAHAHATIVLRGGTYHQTVTIPYGKPLTIQAYPHEAVWFDGSTPVTKWAKSGSVWVSSGWATRFSSDMIGQTSRFVDPRYPAAALPEQLFIDGTAVRQVATAAKVTSGTFAVDNANHRLILGSDPAGHAVRASDLSQAINSMAAGTTLQGFGVHRYATQYDQMGTVRLQNVDSVVRNLVVSDNAMTGLSMSNNNGIADHVTVQRNGQLGIRATAAYGFVMRDSLVSQNNSEHFKTAPESGGVKITKSRGVTVTGNDISGNFSTGLWFDQSDYDLTVVGNVINDNASDNSSANVEVEISAKGVIAGNEMLGGATGLYVVDSGELQVFNNDFGGNSFMSVRMLQDQRRQATRTADTAGERDTRRPAVDPTVPWITRDIAVDDNVFAGGGQFAVYALDQKTHRAVDGWNLSIIGNVFTNHAAGGPQMVAWGLGDNASQRKYQTPAALAAAKGWRNAMVAGAPTAVSAMTSAAAANQSSISVPIPAAIAALLGVPAGSRLIGVPAQSRRPAAGPGAVP